MGTPGWNVVGGQRGILLVFGIEDMEGKKIDPRTQNTSLIHEGFRLVRVSPRLRKGMTACCKQIRQYNRKGKDAANLGEEGQGGERWNDVSAAAFITEKENNKSMQRQEKEEEVGGGR